MDLPIAIVGSVGGGHRAFALVAVVGVLTAAMGVTAAGAQDASGDVVALEEVVARDQLIANQESLLNTYRCLFDIDTHAVPGGCLKGNPAGGPTEPQPFEGTPTLNDVLVRDDLIGRQESLLNTYRCLFDVDTQLVPGNCADQDTASGVYSGELQMHGTSQMVDLMEQVGQLFQVIHPQVTVIGASNGDFDWSQFCPEDRDDASRPRLVGVDHKMPEAVLRACVENWFNWVELPVAVDATPLGPATEPRTFYLYIHDDIGDVNFTEVAYVDFFLSDGGLDAIAREAGVTSLTEATMARSPLPGSLGEQYLLEDSAIFAEMEGISLETAVRTQKERDLIRPYINVVEEARVEDFAGFWWSFEQPNTANFATSGEVEEFGRFVDMTMAHLDPVYRAIVRIVQAEISYREIRDLRQRIHSYMRSEGFVFASDIDVINGEINFYVEPEFVDAFSASLPMVPGLDAETIAQFVRVRAGGLSQPA